MDLRRKGMPSNLESRLARLLAGEQQFTVNYEPKPTGVYDWEDDWHTLIKKAETFESRELQKILVNREQLRMLEKLLNDAYTIRRPKPSEYENRKQVIRVLNDIAKDLYGYSASSPVVEEFGSFSMDLFTAESDLDLSINFPNIPFVFPRELKIKTLRKFAKKLYSLQSAGRVQKVETVMGAKVPILKFVDTATGVECDVSVENMDGIAKSLIIRHICSIDERFQKLSLLMKEWAKAHDINSPKDQTLSSLSIILLVAFHLQTRDPPILPPFSAILKDGDDPALVKNSVRNFQNYGRRNTETLGELFVSFLIKLTSVEDLWSKGLCASSYLGHWTSKTWDHRIAIMSVEDFYDRAQNVARAVGKIEAKIIHSLIHLTIQNLHHFMNVNIEELKLKESLFGSVYDTHHLLEPNLIFKENYEKRTTQTKVTTNKVYNPNGVMDLRAAPSPSTRQLPTGICGAGNGAAFMNGWSQETQPATDSWGSRCQQLPYESERRKKEEMERRAKLDEIAEKQRKREEELEEREWLRKEDILGRGTPIDKPLSDLPVPGSTAPAPVAAADGGGGKYVPKFRRSAAASQQRRHRHNHLIGVKVAIHQQVMESERRKKEEMERRAKLDEIAERQRKREAEPEERERLRKELGKGTLIDKPLSDLPVPGSTAPAPVAAAAESERRKKEEMEGRAKLDEIAERQRKREEELEEREWLRKEDILERGTPIDKPLSDLPVPGSTAPAPVAAAGGGGGKYVPKFRRSAAASQQRRHRHNHLIGGEVAIHQQVMESERRMKEEMERRAKLDEIAERQRKREEELEERERLRKEAILSGTPIDKPLSDLPVPRSTAPAPAAGDGGVKYVPRFRRMRRQASSAATSTII